MNCASVFGQRGSYRVCKLLGNKLAKCGRESIRVILIERIRISIGWAIGDEHCGFREESGSVEFCCETDM